jgi:predicted transcriptional regulator
MPAIAKLRSAKRATLIEMTPAPPPLSLRLGRQGTQALENLARLRGVSKSEAARQAIEETAERERKRDGLAAEASRLMEDPVWVREAQEVVELLEELD